MISLDVDGDLLHLQPETLVVAGYTGADAAAVQHHIDELAAEGVAPPPHVPMYWAMPAAAISQAATIEVPSAATSGEIELALVVDGGDVYLTIGSDHTCREAEAIDIRLSKLICPTPLAAVGWRWDSVADRWSDLILASHIEVDGTAEHYQQATAGGNRPPIELLEGIPWSGPAPRRYVLLCGTVPAIGGIRTADRFTGTVTDPSGRTLELDYRIRPTATLR